MQWKKAVLSGVAAATLVGTSLGGGTPASAAGVKPAPRHAISTAPRSKPAPTIKAAPHAARVTQRFAAPNFAVITPFHTYHVNVTADGTWAGTPGVCETATGNGLCTLRAATQAANADGTFDEIDVPAGFYTLTRPSVNDDSNDAWGSLKLEDTGGLLIKGSVGAVVDGSGTTDSVNGYPDRVLTLPDGYAVATQISWLQLQGGDGQTWGHNGGGVYNGYDGIMTLDHVSVTGNSTGTASGEGGGVYNYGAISITNSSLNNNHADTWGGGLSDESDSYVGTNIANSHFDNNTSGSGAGGAYLDQNAYVTSSTFNDNTTGSSGGGGVYIEEDATLVDVTVDGNYTGSDGGGIYADYNITLLNSRVDYNTADDSDGGGIYVDYTGYLDGDSFSYNHTNDGNGGGIYVEDQTTVVNSILQGNEAYDGGGIYNADGLTARNDDIVNNDTTVNDGYGGGIYNNDYADVSNSRIDHNTAYDGGGIYNSSEYMSVEYSSISYNDATDDNGGVYQDGYMVSNHNVYDHNTALYYGAGMGNYSDLISNNDAYTNNHACYEGGGLYSDYQITLTNSLISGNSVSDDCAGGDPVGGGFYEADWNAIVTNVTIVNNSSEDEGGGIYNEGYSGSYGVAYANVTVAGNTSGATGGGFYGNKSGADPAAFVVTNSIFSGNTPDNCDAYTGSAFPLSGGYNLDGSATCAFNGPRDISGGTANLQPLANNGGPTWTEALGFGSQAIDTGGTSCPSTDQRGIARPQGASCDRGAYEALAGGSANTRFVRRAYNDLLHRAPDAGGLAYWVGRLDGGTARGTFTGSLVNSDEHRKILVKGWYNQFLDRPVGAGALASWVSLLHTHSDASMKASILGGAEYYANAGGGTDTGFVDALYLDIVGRPAGAGAETYWTGKISGGASYTAIATSILRQPESRAYLLNGIYNDLLHRNGGTPGYLNWLLLGMDEAVNSSIAASSEYWTYSQTH